MSVEAGAAFLTRLGRVASGGAAVRDQVASDIATAILGGRYLPGSLLATEAELGAEHGISRTALREALRMLAAKGLIEARQRAGTRVLPRENWNRLDPDVLNWNAQL